jgi:hypothetical protein
VAVGASIVVMVTVMIMLRDINFIAAALTYFVEVAVERWWYFADDCCAGDAL